ncbi:MAG: zf-TFIIB domain-containing protein [Comamonadaceae bacterium]|nr:zf-TFIIB domain-containing protein [Comamonadaceae bacterium]
MPIACPSCRQPMHNRGFAARGGGRIELDLCFACQGLWFDPHENTRLTPEAVMELFELLHAHRGEASQPLASRLRCGRCERALTRGFDVARGGRYVTWRCGAGHGRFSTFGSFMVEKGFVRHLTQPEIAALAARVGTVRCTGCGGPVDIRTHDTCPWCQSALSLLDPQAVDRALERHHDEARKSREAHTPEALADALVAVERQRARDERERLREERQPMSANLLDLGLDLLWGMLRR